MEWKEELDRKGIEMNAIKRDVGRIEEDNRIICNGKVLDCEDTYQYLGTLVSCLRKIRLKSQWSLK